MKITFLRAVPILIALTLILTLTIASTAAPARQNLVDLTLYLPYIVDQAPDTPPIIISGNVQIISIFFDGVKGSSEPDEYVEIRNDDSQPVQMQGWTLVDIQDHWFTFPSYVIEPGQVCRVYTNEIHPDSCGFSYANSAAIWNNGGDCGTLRDSVGVVKSQFCY